MAVYDVLAIHRLSYFEFFKTGKQVGKFKQILLGEFFW
jgi:hypothetical protein